MVLFFLLSSVIVHHKNFSWRPGFFAYLFSFLCFIFVRATIQYATPNSLYKSMTFYLIVSGILILLQVRSSTNMFYVSRFFEYQTSFPMYQGLGFADFHVVASGIILWMLSAFVTRFSLGDSDTNGALLSKRRFLDLTAISLGSIGILYAVSRAGWVAMIFAWVFIFAALFFYGRPRHYFFQALLIAILSLIACGQSKSRGHYVSGKICSMVGIGRDPRHELRNEVSAHTKIQAWELAIKTIISHPIWGIGIDQFPALYYEKVRSKLNPMKAHIDLENRGVNAENSFLSYMVEVGLLPSLFLFALMAYVVYKSLVHFSLTSFPFLLGFIAVCIWAIFADYLKERLFWIAFGMLAGLAENPQSAEK